MVKPQLPITAVVTPSAGDGTHVRVPGDLRVEVGVAVDDARHQRQAVGIDNLSGRFRKTGAGCSYLSLLNCYVLDGGLGARAVKDERVPDEEIKHAL